MVSYYVYKEDSSHTTARPASWGHLPNGGTVANLEAMWAARYRQRESKLVGNAFV
jgi:hypothetical protein